MRDIQRVSVLSLDEQAKRVDDEVVVEEPLEIRINHVSATVTMRTPGDDFDLSIGLLWTEGWIQTAADVGTIAYCPNEEDPQLKNVINITLTDSTRHVEPSRNLPASSSCGLCGKSTVDAIHRAIRPVESSFAVKSKLLLRLPDEMRGRQVVFTRTGGIHAAGLFDSGGNLRLIREDIGRHNAVDKVLGAALRAGFSTHDAVLMVSGRLGFEIAQKAAVAGIPIVASVSAPSSLAIALASRMEMTAVGFVRGSSMKIYTNPQRVILDL